MAFVNLHIHSEYTLLESACKVSSLVKRVKSLGQNACAVADKGVMYACIEFYSKCKSYGIKPIIACECNVCANSKDIASQYSIHQLVLLCKDLQGYKNLTKLVSKSLVDKNNVNQCIDYSMLQEYSQGLVCLSGSSRGLLYKLVKSNDINSAINYAQGMKNLFGDDFYIEVVKHDQKDEQIASILIDIAKKLDIKAVACNESYYIYPEDHYAQDILSCIKSANKLSDTNRHSLSSNQHYIKSEEEMLELFKDNKQIVFNTQEVADKCNVDFDFNSKHLPKFPLEDGKDAFEYLKSLCISGLYERYNNSNIKEAIKRLNYELSVIKQMGFVDYFLIVWDFIRYAKSKGIPVGPGRGSGAGSIVAYCLDITELDPIKYSLIFERFLNPERMSMPDLDIDFCYVRRQEVIDYVISKYGENRVAQIITFGTMAARAVIRDVGRALGISYNKCDRLAKMIPNAIGITLDRAFEINNDLQLEYENDLEARLIIDNARILEGMPRNTSTHAAGVIIAAKDITEYVPLQKNDDIITTQYPMTQLESLGLLKMDFLGLRTLTVINDTIKLINNPNVQSEKDISIEDKEVYNMISKGNTLGLFQLESAGMRKFLQQLKPNCFEDIVAAISLYRPGPMDSIPKYVNGKHNNASVSYISPKLEKILNVTYGCIVYQEQVMQIVRELAGYSLGRTDLMRRAISKKKHDVMQKEREYFIYGMEDEKGNIVVPGCLRNGISKSVAEKIFDDISAFASYAFNKSHAAAYGLVSVRTAWLKCHYPVEFMCSILNSFIDNIDKLTMYIHHCKQINIKILPPNINKSYETFTVEDYDNKKSIRFALSAIKNVGKSGIESIIKHRKDKEYKDFYDFIERNEKTVLNKRLMEALIRCGSFDSMNYTRSYMIANYEKAIDEKIGNSRYAISGQMNFLDASTLAESTNKQDENHLEFSKKQMLDMEKDFSGIYISGHPLDEYSSILKDFDNILESLQEADLSNKLNYEKRLNIAGIINSCKKRITRKNEIMLILEVEDLSSSINVIVFPKQYNQFKDILQENNIVSIDGQLKVNEDEVKLIAQNIKLLKKDEINIFKEKPKERLFIRISSTEIDLLKTILAKFKGESEVIVTLSDTKKNLLMSSNYSCDLSEELVDMLILNFGMENIIIK